MTKKTKPDHNSLQVRLTRLATLLFALFRRKDVKAAALNEDVLILTSPLGPMKIPFQEIETVEVENRWFWGNIRVRYTSGEEIISGLSRHDARGFADALESARINWWIKTLAEHVGTLNSIQNDLAQLADPPMYMARSIFSTLERKARDIVEQFSSQWPDKLSGATEIQMLKTIQEFLKDPEGHRARANDIFVVNELHRSREFFDKIETRPLTDEQRKSVVVNEDRNLVVAAAGSGKTSVIVAKAGWLLRKSYRRPSELLLLAFASDAQKEMQQRIRDRLGDEASDMLTIRTFHSLGMSIIGEVEGRRPTLAKVATDDKALRKLLKDLIAELLDDSKFSKVMFAWFQEHFAPYKSEYKFQTQGEYWDYIRANEIRSLKGDKVRSFEECEIANFLYLNGVPYEYEHLYEHDTATSEKTQYRPDFYLSDSGIYIEHFGINESGDTAPFIDREKYLQSMKWKRQLHSKHGTVLIETFSHEKAAGKLTENLATKLADHNVTLSPISPAEVFAVLQEQGRIDPFTQLVTTFLHHYKEAQLSAEEIARRVAKTEDRPRAEAFITVFKRIFECYQERLAQLKQIDFHDMIGRATEHVESRRYNNPFGYILVDEFQDISPRRARLLKALLDRSATAQLFAVGDDWQAIYRFAGSDIAIMREFRERFGESKRINMETTFRCADRIATVATKFVLRNPAQIPKNVSSTLQLKEPCVHVGLGVESPDLLREAMKTIAADPTKNNGTSTVLLLGRYRQLQPENMYRLGKEHPDLHISYKTVHRSKGLEADYVVVLGLCSGKYGFPTEIADDPLLNIVLAAPEEYPNAEERRLLYVAITRARRRVFLLNDSELLSPFVKELMEEDYDVTVFGQLPESNIPCPECTEGHLKRRKNDQGMFYGCSYFPFCKHTQSTCPNCETGLPVKTDGAFRCRNCGQPVEECPRCDGWMQTKKGKYGQFLGCSNWPNCSYTRNITERKK